MGLFPFAKNGMGSYEDGTGMREDMHMQAFNIFNYQAGVVLPTDLVVTETSPASMAVKVSAGRCFVPNSSYTVNTPNSTKYWGVLAEEATLSIDPNTSGSNRVDLITVKIDAVIAPGAYGESSPSFAVVKGAAGGATPSLPNNSLLIATLTIPTATTTTITNSMIADNRDFVYLNVSPSGIQTFDTTWQGTTRNAVIGTADLDMQYIPSGNRVDVQISAENLYGDPNPAKELTTWGQGEMSFTLPFTAAATGYGLSFQGEYQYSSGPVVRSIIGRVEPGTNILKIYYADPSTNYSDVKVFSWSDFGDGLSSASDYLRLSGYYFKA